MNLQIIKDFEGLRLEPYLDGLGIPTIGYGSTHYDNGNKVTLADKKITEARASELLNWYIDKNVTPTIRSFVKTKLNENQVSAIASFIYNLGPNGFKSSTLLKRINRDPQDPAIASEFKKWDHGNGERIPGLTKRRAAEAKLYFTPTK